MLDALEKIFTILAIMGGGLWAYYHYFKGRVYKLRLEPKIFGKVIARDDADYLITTVQLKNVGLYRADIEQKGTAFRIFACKPPTLLSKTQSVDLERLVTFEVFKKHGWIESGETIEEQKMIAVPVENQIAYQLQLRVVSKKIEWNAILVLDRHHKQPSNQGNQI